ncbi:hypothetical protein BJV78DRAFT_1285222 [Lactifluus subvellereus]|nr:hypothetical protein BJV78DRAFT_1285222 [Lactifluus subvellereus]
MSKISTNLQNQLLAGLDIFKPSRLSTEEDIATAVNVLEDTLDKESIEPIILVSLQPGHPYAFEFILSSISEDCATLVSKFILDKFPSDVDGLNDSLGYQVLSRLSHSLSRLPYPSTPLQERLDDHRRKVEKAPAVLEDLTKLLRGGWFDDAGKGMGTEINDRLFQALGHQAPKSHDSAQRLLQSTMDTQKNTLKFFLTLTRDHATLVRNMYFRENVLHGNLSIPSEQTDLANPETGAPHTYADQIRADLYFGPAAGHGKWCILCPMRWLSDLAQGGAQSKPVLNRLEELSSGHFSETNLKRLTRDSPIDIYRARLPGSDRLVIVANTEALMGQCGTQGSVTEAFPRMSAPLKLVTVLRVLGVYTIGQLKKTDWDDLGNIKPRRVELMCRLGASSGCDYFDPVTFGTPVIAVGAVSADPESLQEIEKEALDEIHRLLDLEKYTFLSQNVVQDILEGHDYHHIFQVSPEEEDIIKCTRSSFVLGRSGTGKTTVIVFKMFGIERAWQNQGCVGPRPRQLFVTKSRLLAEKVEEEYVSLLYSLSATPEALQYVHERIQQWNTRRKEIFNLEDVEDTRDDLPEKYSELRDGHFPLFVTMDTLCNLLEADMKPTAGPSRSRNSRSQKRNTKWHSRTNLVTFDVFKREYWPRMPRHWTKGIAPSLVFSDFLGNIKGSEKSLDYPNRALDREAYENLRNTHTLDYALFEAYQKLKLKRSERDFADRTHTLLDGLKENGLKGDLVDFVYVDEVQDMLLIDTRMIISLCRNPDGLLWAGDTAQTISIGSTFSFTQLGASVYRYQRSIGALRGTPRQPEGFQLLVNYRSHGGIVECANAIIQLLERFPGAIDVLRPETAVVGKELPMFFHGNSLPPGRDFFLSASTLFNSKGLEYDDVILYDFFGESADVNLWRHLVDEDYHMPRDLKHAPLIHELKSLYVAITRARHRLWIVDYSHKCEPIKRCLRDRGLIVEPPIPRNPLESFAKESTEGEWSDEGTRLLNHKVFEEALMAFENAGDVYGVAVALAYQSQEVARSIPESQTHRRQKAFFRAAGAFEHCAEVARDDGKKRSHYAVAARCYRETNSCQDTVRTLKLANMYIEAASYCLDNNLIDSAVSIIKEHEDEVDSDTAERVEQVAGLRYLDLRKLELDKAKELFRSDEEMMEFVDKHNLGIIRAILLTEQGRYGEAVKQYIREGQETEALDLALGHMGNVTLDVDAFSPISRRFLWRYLSFGCRRWPEISGVSTNKILALLGLIPRDGLNDRDEKVLYIFKLILQEMRSTNTLKILSNRVLRCDGLDKAVKLLAFDYFFDNMSLALDVDAALDKAPWKSSWLSTLFQFKEDGKSIWIQGGTFLHEAFVKGGPSQSTERREPAAVSQPRKEFVNNLSRLLSERLYSRIKDKDRILSRLSVFDPCIQLVLRGTCHEEDPASHQLDEAWFNRRVRFHLQQIMILDNLLAIGWGDDNYPARNASQRHLLNTLENALNPLLHVSGSISNLNQDLIPEAADGFSTVKRWAFDVLYTLDPSRDELQGAFLTNLYKAFTLAQLRQDGRVVNDYLRHIPSATPGKRQYPRLVVSQSGGRIYTLPAFLAFMDGSGNLAQGINFFSLLVRERIPVDLAEAAWRPFARSWILALWKDFITFKDRQLAPLSTLAQTTENLLKDIYTGEYLKHTMKDPKTPGRRDSKNRVKNWSRDLPWKYLQDLCVARICFCLLGENFSDLRDNVVRTMTSLGTIRRPESTAFHGRTITFRHLVKLNLEGSSESIPGPHLPSVNLVTFNKMEAIPNVLQSCSSDRQDDLPSGIDVITDSHESPGVSGTITAKHISAADGIDEVDDTPDGDKLTEGVAKDDAVDAGEGEVSDRTNEALVIQRALRRHMLKRIEESPGDTLTIERNRLFRACKASANAVHSRYRNIYLGPVPHLLLCLGWIFTRTQASKGITKGAQHPETTLQVSADLTVQQNQMSEIFDEACNLQKSLEPGSSIHPREDLEGGWNATRHLNR